MDFMQVGVFPTLSIHFAPVKRCLMDYCETSGTTKEFCR